MYPAETISLEKGKLTLSGKLGQLTRGPVIELVDPTNNLPTSQAYSYDSKDTPVQASFANNHDISQWCKSKSYFT
jgi:hypothetical protein